MFGFKFNNRHTSEFNLCVKSEDRPFKPNFRMIEEKIEGTNGSQKFKDGYDDIIISFTCELEEEDYFLRKRKLREISNWLNVLDYKELIIDDESDIFYKAICITQLNTEVIGAVDKFQIQFSCKPFKYSVRDKLLLLDKNLKLGSDVKLGTPHFVTTSTDTTLTMDIDSTAEIEDFRIKIIGTMEKIKINNMELSNCFGTNVIDIGKKIVYMDTPQGIVNKINDFNKIFEKIDYKQKEYVAVIQFTNLIGSATIEFDFQNTYI